MQSRANYHFSPSTGSGTALLSRTALHSVTILFVLTVALTFCSCVPKHKGSARLKVVASVPVIYDWTRNLMNDSDNTNLFLNLIIKNGFNYHNLVPGVTEENLIDSANLLIYAGGESEKWIDEYVEKTSSEHPDRIVLRLFDYAQLNDQTEIDEHILISPSQAVIFCNKISEALCTLDSENQALYKQCHEKYNQLLTILDDTYKLQAQKTKDTVFIICDCMPFKAFFNEYGFNYIAVYDYCPVIKTKQVITVNLKEFGEKIDETGASAVYCFENSDKKLAKQVIANSKNPKCDTLVFDSMESLTLSQLFSGKNYIDIMRNNLTLLRPN